MTDVNELNSLSCSLAGCALIEAAAGTGKTYNIQNIFARCILEKGMTVDQLVVVTFTKAATMELKMRIRKILVDIREAMENEDDLTDEQKRAQKLLDAVKAKLKEEMPAPEKEVRRRLENALLDIDQANIFTIDGFCQRILNEFAVSGGVRFAIEPIADNKKEIREFSSVFMRRTENGFSQDGEDKFIYDSLCAAVGIKVDMLEELAIVDAEKSGVKLIWPEAQNCNAENGDLLKPMKDFMQKVRDFYQNLRERPGFSLDNREAFIKSGNSRGNSVNNAKYVRWALFGGKDPGADEGLREFREWISGTGTKMPNIFAAVIQAAPEQLSKAKTNKSAKNSEENFEDFYALVREIKSHAEDLEKLLEGFRHALLWRGLEFVRNELNAHQMRTGTMSYNAVQQTLAAAVKNNEEFRRQLQERYKGIIVDEFQDTNTAQYEIFSEIFGGNGGDNLFFMVGDPRQAIYSFRGGDVFAYLNARNHVKKEGRYTLSTNYRSSGDIVGHICNLFKGNSFAHDEITIGNLNAGGDNNNLHFFNRAGDVQQSPVFLVKDRDAGEKGSSDDAKQARRTADLVMQLMNGGWTIGTRDERRAVKSSDIAVLCRSNQTATAVIRELQRKGIPAYHSRQTNIMTTDEAREMAVFMNGVVHHDESSALYAALHTDICGLTEDVLAELVNTPEKYQEHYDRFKNYHNTWAGKSFSAVFAMAKGNYETFTRLASRKNGERALVNYEHLADLIQAQESRGRLTPAASLRALQRMIADADNEETPEGYEQQLASEKAALSVMTIHHSKGLEFPVVILPDVDKDDKPPSKDKAQCYHNGAGELCWNVAAKQPDDAREGCYLESFQEKMRLLYVALTRAKYAAFVLAGTAEGKADGSGKMQNANALHWLNSGGKFPFADAEERTWGEDVGGETPRMTDFEFNVSYAAWEDDSAGDAQQTELKKPKEVDLAFRNSWRMASYSGVVKHKKTQRADDGVNLIVTRDDENDEEDYDAGALPEEGLDAAGGYAAEGAAHPSFDFPRGAMIGTLIHTCLEKLDFTLEADSPELREAVVNAFAWRYPENTPAFEGLHYMVRSLLQAEFSLHDGAPFRLKDLTASRRELEFHFSIGNDFQWDKFAALLQTGDDDVNARINHIVLNKGSIFNGVIDFIFIHEGKIYILDWKSDLLKKDLASYRPEALADVMCGSGYDVQYHIYLAALMRYMEQRLGTGYSPELHDRYFGGVYYVFTRGVEPSRRNNGIYFCRPDYARMESIREIFGKA